MQRGFFSFLTLLAILCATAGASAESGYWVNVPYVAQQRDGCGAAVISMVMRYWAEQQGHAPDSRSDPEAIFQHLYTRSTHGIYSSAMERYLQQNGFRTFAFSGRWQDFTDELRYGRPLIVALKPDASSSLHYAVVAGVDPDQQVVLLNDPARRKLLKEDRVEFEHEWKATHNWALLALPQTPAQAR